MTLLQQRTIVLTAELASIGTAIVVGFDRILDMFRTTTNIFGDNSSVVVISALEGDQDRNVDSIPLSELETRAL